MSAFPNTGHSDGGNQPILSVRFRPEVAAVTLIFSRRRLGDGDMSGDIQAPVPDD